MGNQFQDPNGASNFRGDNTTLGNYIKDFLKNKYKFINKDDILKKRACCLRSTTVQIALPSYNPETKKVVTTVLKMPIFTEDEMKNKYNEICTFNGAKFTSGLDNNGKFKGREFCNDFME